MRAIAAEAVTHQSSCWERSDAQKRALLFTSSQAYNILFSFAKEEETMLIGSSPTANLRYTPSVRP